MTPPTFFAELQRIINLIPKEPTRVFNSQDCQYCNYTYHSDNLYFGFDMANSQDCIYIFDSYMAVNCVDADYIVECEESYDCVDLFQSSSCSHSFNCDHCRDTSWSWDCSNCHDVFGCVHLANKSFCIFNRQLTESEYRAKVKIYQQWPQQKIIDQLRIIYTTLPVRQLFADNNENSPYGNNLFFNKNVYLSFDAAHDENCGYLYDSFYNKNCYDMTYASRYNEYSYQVVESDANNESCFIVNSSNCQNSFYLFNCKNVKNSFGCAGLRNRQYCILNRQLTKEQYEIILPKIKEELTKTDWGWNNINF